LTEEADSSTAAWARAPDRERLEGRGSGPEDALLALTVELKKLRRFSSIGADRLGE
jgi:hypothetical protein